MSEIRNLTRNGETFYPLTIIEAVSDPSGNYIGNYVSNPEWIRVITDSEGKVLAGIKANGEVEWSLGVPTPVKEYIQGILSNYSTTSEIQEALSNIQTALSGKVDKIEGKSLSTNDYTDTDKEIVNVSSLTNDSEFLEVTTDNEGKILEATKIDGTKVISGSTTIGGDAQIEGNTTISGDATILGNVDIQGVTYTLIQNPEWIRVIVDAQDHTLCGIKADGSIYLNSLTEIPSIIQNAIQGTINTINVEIASLDERISAIESVFSLIDNPEYIAIETDNEGKILSGRNTDGSKFENLPMEFKDKVSIDGNTVENTQDPEGRTEIKTDSTGKILSYRDKEGVLHENVGIKTNDLSVDNIHFNGNAVHDVKKVIEDNPTAKSWKLPEYGTVNLDSEDFYVTANLNVSDIEDLTLVQLLERTTENAYDGVPLSAWFVGDTRLLQFAYGNVKLNSEDNKYYAKTTIRKVNGVCYYLDTLGFVGLNVVENNKKKVIDGYSVVAPYDAELAELGTKQIQVEVIPITGRVELDTWAVNKNDKHHVVGSVDFGDFYQKNPCYLEVKFQGRGTLFATKKNLRLTFYKAANYSKKDKIKIGELLRLSGYNMKSQHFDHSRMKELILYRLVLEIWQKREMYDRYPWYKEHTPMCGATGTINGFHTRLNINRDFYGVYYFALKKDERNYMMDSDYPVDGAFVQSEATHITTFWTTYYSNLYEDQMNDYLQADVNRALNVLYNFINSEQICLGEDGVEYPLSYLKDIDGTMYIRNTLAGTPTVDSIVATKISGKDTYLGSDNIEYPESWITAIEEEVGGETVTTMYVTRTLHNQMIKEGSKTATLLETSFVKKNISERMSVYDWIDYLILIQVFCLWDNNANNIILYSDKNLKKWWSYFYDIDHSLEDAYIDQDCLHTVYDGGVEADTHIWYDLKDLYWDEILNRYYELRKGILSDSYINSVISSYKNVPDDDVTLEQNKWRYNINVETEKFRSNFIERLKWLDDNYFV